MEKTAEDIALELLAYIRAHPQQRFWQSIRNFSEYNFVGVSEDKSKWDDTFYWPGLKHQAPDLKD